MNEELPPAQRIGIYAQEVEAFTRDNYTAKDKEFGELRNIFLNVTKMPESMLLESEKVSLNDVLGKILSKSSEDLF